LKKGSNTALKNNPNCTNTILGPEGKSKVPEITIPPTPLVAPMAAEVIKKGTNSRLISLEVAAGIAKKPLINKIPTARIVKAIVTESTIIKNNDRFAPVRPGL